MRSPSTFEDVLDMHQETNVICELGIRLDQLDVLSICEMVSYNNYFEFNPIPVEYRSGILLDSDGSYEALSVMVIKPILDSVGKHRGLITSESIGDLGDIIKDLRAAWYIQYPGDDFETDVCYLELINLFHRVKATIDLSRGLGHRSKPASVRVCAPGTIVYTYFGGR